MKMRCAIEKSLQDDVLNSWLFAHERGTYEKTVVKMRLMIQTMSSISLKNSYTALPFEVSSMLVG